MPYFSVIIPLYNKENYIGKAISAILGQSFQDFEIIIVDDCSTDRSLAKAQQVQSEKISYVRHERNSGLSAARNTGIRHAGAKYVVFLDADDTWTPQFLERIKALIEAYPQAQLFATAYAEVYPGNMLLAPSVNKSDLMKGTMSLITDFFVKNLQQPIYNHSSLCIEKSLFGQIGHYDETVNFSEDVEFNIRANLKSPLAYYNGVESYYTVYSENQITTSGIRGKRIPDLGKFEAVEKQNPKLKKYIDFERYVLATHCKLAGDRIQFRRLTAAIDPRNLTLRQRLLLKMPAPLLSLIRRAKMCLLRKGYRVTSY